MTRIRTFHIDEAEDQLPTEQSDAIKLVVDGFMKAITDLEIESREKRINISMCMMISMMCTMCVNEQIAKRGIKQLMKLMKHEVINACNAFIDEDECVVEVKNHE